jgi:predicted RNase H-like HicB family nuclease
MREIVQAQFDLFGVIKKQKGWFIAHCPLLDITTQGTTEAEARKNLIEACERFVVSCFERGTFEQALRELGWQVVAGQTVPTRSQKSATPSNGAFRFPVPVPFGFEKATNGCPA